MTGVTALLALQLAADSAAFAALSPIQRDLLDVRSELAAAGLTCVALGGTSDGARRWRLQGRLGDSSSLVLFARHRDAAILRVEFVRTRRGVQRGYTWDADGNVATGVDWNADRSRASSYPVPAGGPVPHVLRSLAWRVVQRCGQEPGPIGRPRTGG